MQRLPCVLFALLLAGAAIFLLTTVDRLPEIVATHFDGSGRPNGWMTRRGYLWFSLWMIGASLAGIGAWIYALYRRFGKPA